MLKKTTTCVFIFTIAVIFLSASAHAIMIDFEGQSAGDIITGDTISGATFTVTDQGNTSGNPRDLMIFNSNCIGGGCSGGDSDLSTSSTINAGNILIISEDNDMSDPDDSANGGIIITKFDTNITFIEAVTVDVGDSGSTGNQFKVFLDGIEQDVEVLMTNQGDNNIQIVSFMGLFDEIQFTLTGSGALASYEFTPIPVPAALPLFLTGLLGLLGMRKKAMAS